MFLEELVYWSNFLENSLQRFTIILSGCFARESFKDGILDISNELAEQF